MHQNKVVIFVLSFSIVVFLCLGSPRSALAVTLTAVLNPDHDSTNATYEEIHTALIDYPQNSQIANLFKNSPSRIVITATSLPIEQNKKNAATMQTFLDGLNEALTNAHSNAQATSASLKFIADIKHYSTTESMVAQRALLTLGLQGYMLPNNQDLDHKYVDFNWRSFTVNQPVVLSYTDNKTGTTKNIEINHMSGVLESVMPGFMNALMTAGAPQKTISLLQTPVINYDRLSESMDKWYHLFDPAASLVETQGYGYKGEANGAKVDTIYSLGEGSFREGVMEPTTSNSNFGTSPNTYSLSFTVPPPAARIDLLGYSKMTTSGDSNVAIISKQNEGGSSYAGNFPLVVLTALGGMMGGIVAFVLIKTRTRKEYTTR